MNWIERTEVQALLQHWQALSHREKQLLEGTALMVVSVLAVMLLEPLWLSAASLREQAREARTELTSLQQQVAQLEQLDRRDPNQALRVQQQQLARHHERIQAQVSGLSDQLVSPQDMVGLLRDVLQQTPNLELLSLTNLEPQPIWSARQQALQASGTQYDPPNGRQSAMQTAVGAPLTAQSLLALTGQLTAPAATVTATSGDGSAVEAEHEDATATPQETPIFWRHGLRLTMKVTWGATRDWLERMQQLPTSIYWQRLDFRLLGYPWAELTLEVYTLSSHKEVLGV